MFKVVQWATGSVGRTALRRIIDHPDLELAGLYVYDPGKVGRDAGDIAKRPATGVKATNRIEDILALDADVVLHAPRISVPYADQNVEVVRLLASGKNVISVNGYYMPEVHGADYAGPLLEAARRGNATLAGIGLNPGFVAERIALAMTAMMARLEHIECCEMVDGSNIPARELAFGVMGFGTDPTLTDITHGPLAQLYASLYSETFAYTAEVLGTRVVRIEPDHRVTPAPRKIRIAAGTVEKGAVAATEWRWNAEFADGCAMTHSLLWTSDPSLHYDRDAAHWTLRLKGRPNVEMNFKVEDPDPSAPASRAAMDATVALMVRAIPDVCAAPAGFYRLPAAVSYRRRF
ncbi:MAG: dihydrodipicolinate reductase [Gammaproteobacteria bacterium]|nr:dihydrodipicolinate reductase [Gammaproteobacteria bacterium]